MTIGIVGLGTMGMGIAANLLKAGFPVIGHDVNSAALTRLASIGGTVATSLPEVGEQADHIMILVLTSQQVLSVMDEQTGICKTIKPGTIVTIMSTVGTDTIDVVAELCSRHSASLIDSPVTGGRKGADDGTLTLIVAGAESAVEQARPAFAATSARQVIAGRRPGDAQKVKAALQIVVSGCALAVTEAFSFADAMELSDDVLGDVLTGSVVTSPLLNIAVGALRSKLYTGTGTPLALMEKDLAIVAQMAGNREIGLPLNDAVRARLRQAGEAFSGEDIWSVRKLAVVRPPLSAGSGAE